jgi:RecB family exonuclease
VITPRRTRLLRVPDLHAFRRAIAETCRALDLAACRSTAVIVPTTAAAAELRVTLENLLLLDGLHQSDSSPIATVLPDLVTRDEWYRQMHEYLPVAPPVLSRLERDVLALDAAREAIDAGFAPPFRLRPGLVSGVLELYDELHRHRRTVDAFERLLVGELEPQAETDRGAARLLSQTRFLVAVFRAYERRRFESGRLDEHALREMLLQSAVPAGYARVIVTVGARAWDPGGLFAADFDLLTRVNGLEALDVIATDEALDTGMGDRIREMLPGIDEIEWTAGLPPGRESAPVFILSRDREEELAAIARAVKAAWRHSAVQPLDRTAVVFKRPLPYVYLAQTVFNSAGIPFEAADAVPLAAEPYAAMLDLVVSFVESGFARAATTALLSCAHLAFDDGGASVDQPAVSALDRALADAGYLGGRQALVRIAGELTGAAAAAARCALRAADDLALLTETAPASRHLAVLMAFLDRHERGRPPQDEAWARHQRARAAIRGALEDLRGAHVRYGDQAGSFEDVSATLRRWMETQTFSPRRGTGGVHLVDSQAARYGDYDDVFLVGLVETDWPGARAPNIFYPASLLATLGWPAEQARLSGTRAAFLELTGLARRALTLSAFTLEDDALVGLSPLLDEIIDAAAAAGPAAGEQPRIFLDEALVFEPVRGDVLPEPAKPWLSMRQSRTPASDARFHGAAGPYVPGVYTVSSIDVYLDCPFKFLATYVLKIEEEPDDDEGLTPRARGEFVHDVMRRFYKAWAGRGGCSVTPGNLDDARRLFADVASRALDELPPGDAVTERLRLLGSPVTPAAGDIVLAAEATMAGDVIGRLLEHSLEGEFDIAGDKETRRVRLRGKVDRIDLLAGSSFRIVDYKTGRAPEWRRSIQLPVYAVCTAQWLARVRGGRWDVAEAAYLVLSGKDHVRTIVPDGKGSTSALASGQQRLLDAIDGMARGEFPPRPAEPRLCTLCRFSAVCRKDYVVDD